jgi:hypothetical protein
MTKASAIRALLVLFCLLFSPIDVTTPAQAQEKFDSDRAFILYNDVVTGKPRFESLTEAEKRQVLLVHQVMTGADNFEDCKDAMDDAEHAADELEIAAEHLLIAPATKTFATPAKANFEERRTRSRTMSQECQMWLRLRLTSELLQTHTAVTDEIGP